MRLLQRFKSFTLAPDFMPAGSLPPGHWAGMPGRQGFEKIHPAINFTMHSKVRVARGGGFFFTSRAESFPGFLFIGWRLVVCRIRVFAPVIFRFAFSDAFLRGGGIRGSVNPALLPVRGVSYTCVRAMTTALALFGL